MLTTEEKIFAALTLATRAIIKLHPDPNPNRISDEAFSVTKYIDTALGLLDPTRTEMLMEFPYPGIEEVRKLTAQNVKKAKKRYG